MLSARTKITFPGWHYWAAAPDGRHAFLREPHRHMFTFEVEVLLEHNDRQVEFFDLQKEMHKVLPLNLILGAPGVGSSCEALAEDMGKVLHVNGYKVLEVLVSEDGESAGIWRPS